MDAESVELIPMKLSPSLLWNNCSYQEGKMVFARMNTAILVKDCINPKKTELVELGINDLGQVLQVKFAGNAIVVASQSGVQFLDKNGTKILNRHDFEESADKLTLFRSTFARGICSVANPTTGTNLILVGYAPKHLLVFDEDKDYECVKTIPTNQDAAFVDIIAHPFQKDKVISCNDEGVVCVWTVMPDLTVSPSALAVSSLREVPCACIAVHNHLLAVGYASGQFALYDLKENKRLVEVAAHSRPITQLCFHCDGHLIATVSMDTHLRVWAISLAPLSITLYNHAKVADRMLCGVHSLTPTPAVHGAGADSTDPTTTGVIVTAYDSRAIYYFKKAFAVQHL